jgi:hypothetical protein
MALVYGPRKEADPAALDMVEYYDGSLTDVPGVVKPRVTLPLAKCPKN